MPNALPWLRPALDALEARRRIGRLPHALLLAGPDGLGKFQLAESLAKRLLCDSPSANGDPCENCRACSLSTAGSHPDLRVVTPEEGKHDIGVERIRELAQYLGLTSQRGRAKIAIISPAERMTASASNALLKTLEEPTPDTVLVLVSPLPGQLPATIRSRCQCIAIHPVPASELRKWLGGLGREAPEWAVRQCEGAPLRALEWIESEASEDRRAFFEKFRGLARGSQDVTVVCEGLDAEQTRFRLGMLIAWIQDMVRIRLTSSNDFVRNADLGTELAKLAGGVDIADVFGRLERTESAARLCGTSVNRQLLLEDALLPWCERQR